MEPEFEAIHYRETQETYNDSNGVSIPETELKMTRINFGPTLRKFTKVDDVTTHSYHIGVRGMWTDVSTSVSAPSTGFTNLNRDGLTTRLEGGLKWDWDLGAGSSSTLELDVFLDGLLTKDSETQGLSLKYGLKF